MNYRNYKDINDFICDENFKNWVKFPDMESDLFWQDFLRNNPAKRSLILQAKELILLLEFEESVKDFPNGDEIENLRQNILSHSKKFDDDEGNWNIDNIFWNIDNIFRINTWPRYAVAASFMVVILSIGIFLSDINELGKGGSINWITKSTGKGEVLNFYMSDGSKVKLNRESKLIFPSKFESTNRTVKLVGEAFFEVTEDELSLFEVQTEAAKVRVLGTSFDVNAYPNQETSVTVVSGKVEVENVWNPNEQDIILLPNDMVVIDENIKRFEKATIDVIKELSWKEGILHFEGASLQEVVKELEWWFGVDINLVGENRGNEEIFARYENNSLEYILKALVFYSDIEDYSINEKTVTIKL